MFGMKRSRGAAMLLASGVPEKERSSDAEAVKKQRIIIDSDAIRASDAQAATSKPLPESALPLSAPELIPQHTNEVLNDEGRLLLRVWEVMLNALPMLNKRKERITISTLAPIVEAHTGKRFRVELVQKIKHVYPDAFKWQYVMVPSRSEPSQPEQQLLLQFERSGGKRLSESEERRELKEKILAFLSSPGHPNEVPLATLPVKDSCSMFEGMVKSLPIQACSPPDATTATGTPSSAQSSRTVIPSLPSAHPLSPTASISCRPPMYSSSQLEASSPTLRPSARTRNPLLERFLSAEALEILDEAEAKRSSLPEVLEHRARLNALTKLPNAFDMVRYIFGVGGRGPSLMDKEEVVEKLKSKSTERGGISMKEARLQVDLLIQNAPDFITVEGPCGINDRGVDVREGERVRGLGSLLRINRSCQLDKLRPRLVKMASDALVQLKSQS